MNRLTRIDPDRNMSRYYQLHIQPSLFGDCDLVREWGRIGSPGTIRTAIYPTLATATAALAEAVKQRHKRGYCTTRSCPRIVGPCTLTLLRQMLNPRDFQRVPPRKSALRASG